MGEVVKFGVGKYETRSALEQLLNQQLTCLRVPKYEREFFFAEMLGRKWRFDFAWPADRVACEVAGGIWVAGRHTRGGGFERDAEKYSHAAILGWRVLHVTGKHVKSGLAAKWIEEALLGRHV